MWTLLSRRTQLTFVVFATALIVWAIQTIVALTGQQPVSPLKLVSLVVFLLGTGAVTIANWTWRPLWQRFPVLGRVFFPDLNGTWKGTLKSTWKDENGNLPGPIDTTIWIRQSLFTLHVQQRTSESDSWSQRVFPEALPSAGRFGLWYSYSNVPQAAVSHRSSPHDGVARLEMNVASDVGHMTGQYFTSRRTSGDIEIRRVSAAIVE